MIKYNSYSEIFQHLQNQNGFKMISSSYDKGRISCTFTRSILADNLNEDRNLNESAYLLLAAGSTRGKWVKWSEMYLDLSIYGYL